MRITIFLSRKEGASTKTETNKGSGKFWTKLVKLELEKTGKGEIKARVEILY